MQVFSEHPRMSLPGRQSLRIDGVRIDWRHIPEVTSTMDIAALQAHRGGTPWSVISADVQTQGRGTHGRTWYSPAAQGFWVSVLLPLPENIGDADGYTIRAAEALADAIKALTGLSCTIKHPNDVMVNGRKLAGILIESVSAGNRPISLVLGMGINMHQTLNDFTAAGLDDATSLAIETDRVPDRASVLRAVVARLIARLPV